MADHDVFIFSVAPQDAGLRLDAFTAGQIPDCSRSYAALLIRQGRITVDASARKPSYKLKVHEQVRVDLPEPQPVDIEAEEINLDLLFEDDWIIVVNKPAGLVVHPAAGHPSGTLVNGLLHHCPNLEGIGGERRPGIVHRLDKDTSGVIVIAKTTVAHHELSRQFKARQVEKQYLALVHGVPQQPSGRIDLPVGRHPVDRKKMSTIGKSGRVALTLWRVKERFAAAALLDVDLKTGRTHQIRVHCQAMGHPLVGDTVYGKGKGPGGRRRDNLSMRRLLEQSPRQLLHAAQLGIHHPVSDRHIFFRAPLPDDMARMLNQLRSASEA